MRRKDRETDRGFAIRVLDKCEWATVAMSDGNAPYCVALSIVREDDFIYFHSAKYGRKTDILRKNPKVCVSCVGETLRPDNEFTTEFESAIVFGKAYEIENETEKIKALKLLCLRHTPLNMAEFDNAVKKSLHRTAVWRIEIDEISGKQKNRLTNKFKISMHNEIDS